MSAYLIARVRIADKDAYARYVAVSAQLVAQYGGEFIARGGASFCLEGDGFDGRLVIVRFPSAEQARAWYESPAYAEAKAIRQPVSQAELMVVDGIA
ncbi:MAG: DUF1330 domain-containing protein [Proteobacteria bacterium]|nr:DUF1330 domain-containing protein [Pseudomonadota bacterium]